MSALIAASVAAADGWKASIKKSVKVATIIVIANFRGKLYNAFGLLRPQVVRATFGNARATS
jgi:hypothetical protein